MEWDEIENFRVGCAHMPLLRRLRREMCLVCQRSLDIRVLPDVHRVHIRHSSFHKNSYILDTVGTHKSIYKKEQDANATSGQL
jgi:hypothetical protein